MSKVAIPTRVTIQFDAASSIVNYVGEAAFGSSVDNPVWRIKRLTYDGSSFVLDWADGNDEFDNVWTDRSSLSYL